jgi:hypothetical protein
MSWSQKAEQCRRLSRGINDAATVELLLALAVEFEANAATERRRRAQREILDAARGAPYAATG